MPTPSDTAEIVLPAEWDTVKSDFFARTAIRYIQCLPAAKLLKTVVVHLNWRHLGNRFLTEKTRNTVFKGQWLTCDFGKELAGEVYISEQTKETAEA